LQSFSSSGNEFIEVKNLLTGSKTVNKFEVTLKVIPVAFKSCHPPITSNYQVMHYPGVAIV
jgi:hypothetical protein